MKRDMELIRLLLLKVEGEDIPDLSRFTEEQQTYHLAQLINAELAHGGVVEDERGYPCAAVATWLTWKGHEFLDAARNETIWKKAISRIKATGAALPLPILQDILTQLIRKQIDID